MQVRGWLLDVRLRDDEAFLWVKTGNERVEFRCEYYPDFYMVPDKISFEEFMDLLDEHPHIPVIDNAERFTSISDTKQSPVLRVSVDSTEQYRTVLRLVEKYGDVYDGDLSHTQRFLADYGLIPFGEVVLDVGKAGMFDSIEAALLDLRVEPPPFKVLCFELYQEDEKLSIITLDEGMREEYSFTGAEVETLRAFTEFIEETDPDLISCLASDMKKLLKLGIKHRQPSLGIYQRKRFHLNDGRVFISLHIYRRTSLAGIVERIMYTREVPRIGSEYAAGRAIESRQCYEARRLGYMLPRRGFYQPVMSLEELLRERDHGGLIFAPSVGLHENVAALDFESMFPHLILKENISYENVRSGRESEGFLLDFTRDTLERRLYFKHHRKELMDKPDEWFWCETRQQALKEILFCTYGYSGCWANKFGNMDTFMEINKAARENLVEAMNIARSRGFHTLYGNSDSLFLEKPGAGREDFNALATVIKEQLGLPITVENHFKYLVLLPQKSGKDFGAINRYYGLRYDGEIVCRGIELRRRNTPKFIAETQREAISKLLSQDSKEDVLTKGIEAVNKLIDKASRELKQCIVPIEELEAKTILRRKPQKYKARLPHVTAAEAMGINGSEVERGSVIGYVYVDSGHSNPFRRVSPAGYQNKFDYKKYVQLLHEAEKSILLPFIREKENVSEAVRLDRFF
jgi:DNA polymerase elongation subunit (family B)